MINVRRAHTTSGFSQSPAAVSNLQARLPFLIALIESLIVNIVSHIFKCIVTSGAFLQQKSHFGKKFIPQSSVPERGLKIQHAAGRSPLPVYNFKVVKFELDFAIKHAERD